MPEIFYRPIDRRDALKTTLLAGAAVAVGIRSATAQELGGNALHLALLSDTHIPADRNNRFRGMSPWENLKRIVPDVVAAKPEGVIINGDAARLSGEPEDYLGLKEQLEPVAAMAPVYIGMGNHDERRNFHKVFGEGKDRVDALNGKQVLLLDHPAVRVLVLDSLLYVNKVAGLLGRDQREWLKTYLGKHTDRPVVLFIHHTLGDGDGDLLDADRLFEILKPNPQVKAIFYGHSHRWNISERQGVKMINLPAVGYNFGDDQPVGWVDAKFDGKGVGLTLHAIGGRMEGDGEMKRVEW